MRSVIILIYLHIFWCILLRAKSISNSNEEIVARLAFAMTINEVQRQSLQVCGLDLENPCHKH